MNVNYFLTFHQLLSLQVAQTLLLWIVQPVNQRYVLWLPATGPDRTAHLSRLTGGLPYAFG